MNKIMALLSLFRKGEQLANSAAWTQHQITGTMVGVFLIALVQAANAFGISIPLDQSTAVAIGGGVIGIWNVLLTVLNSKHAGFSASAGELPVAEQTQPSVPASVEPEAQSQAPTVQPVSKPADVPAAGDIQSWLDFAHKELERTRADDSTYRGI